MTTRRRTDTLVRVAVQLMLAPHDRHYGYQLMKTAPARSGTLYPILDRMLADGWLTDAWDMDDQTRRPRRYYTLTDHGRRELGAIAADARTDPRHFGAAGGLAVNP